MKNNNKDMKSTTQKPPSSSYKLNGLFHQLDFQKFFSFDTLMRKRNSKKLSKKEKAKRQKNEVSCFKRFLRFPITDRFSQLSLTTPPEKVEVLKKTSSSFLEISRSSTVDTDSDCSDEQPTLKSVDSASLLAEEEINSLPLSFADEPLEYHSDMTFPKGPLKIISHEILMGPLGWVTTGIFRNRYKVVLKECTSNMTSDKRMTRSEKSKLENELDILRSLGAHDKILFCYGVMITNSSTSGFSTDQSQIQPTTHVAYELACYSSLDHLLQEKEIQCIPLGLVLTWLNDLSDALQFIHSKGIVHGEVRAENIFVFERLEIKLGNFTSARSSDDFPVVPGVQEKTFGVNPLSLMAAKSYSVDVIGFLFTSLQILYRKSSAELEDINLFDEEGEKHFADALFGLPVTDFSFTSKLYDLFTACLPRKNPDSARSSLERSTGSKENRLPRKLSFRMQSSVLEQKRTITTMQEISQELLSLLEVAYEGDPRDKDNAFSAPIRRVELVLMAATHDIDKLLQLCPRLSRKSQITLRRAIQNFRLRQQSEKDKKNLIETPEGLMDPEQLKIDEEQEKLATQQMIDAAILTVERIIDYRQYFARWLIKEFSLKPAYAEEAALVFVKNQVFSPELLVERLKMDSSFLEKLSTVHDEKLFRDIQRQFIGVDL
jgi:serine/threonine protein kinase